MNRTTWIILTLTGIWAAGVVSMALAERYAPKHAVPFLVLAVLICVGSTVAGLNEIIFGNGDKGQ